MKGDIVMQLRNWASRDIPGETLELEAANEIERLRKIIKDYHQAELEYSQAVEHSEYDDDVEMTEEWKRAWTALHDEACRD